MPDSARSQFPENLAEPWAARESCQLHASLLAAGFENVAETAFLPGGAARYVWARAPQDGLAKSFA